MEATPSVHRTFFVVKVVYGTLKVEEPFSSINVVNSNLDPNMSIAPLVNDEEDAQRSSRRVLISKK
jgi:hypothetical protein